MGVHAEPDFQVVPPKGWCTQPQTGRLMALSLEEKRSQGPSRQVDLRGQFGKDGGGGAQQMKGGFRIMTFLYGTIQNEEWRLS